MGGWDHLILPSCIIGTCVQVIPLLLEVQAYYARGGQVIFDITLDDTSQTNLGACTDWWVHYKRFCDRPPGEASKAWYAWLDWSSPVWDKSAYIARRNMAKGSGEYSKWRVFTYGPFRLNWWRAHSTPWARGQDAATMHFPIWGDGGEARAREEYNVAKDNCLNRYWHYQRIKQVKKQQLEKAKAIEAGKPDPTRNEFFTTTRQDSWPPSH